MSCASDPRTAAVCRSAAKQRWICALDFVNGLKARHLKSFWYFCSTACLTLLISFGNILVGSSTDSSEEEFYLAKLREFRWTLKINAGTGASFMTAAIGSMILDPNEIRINPLSGLNLITNSKPRLQSNFGISPQGGFAGMPIQPTTGPAGSSSIASGWGTPTSFNNPPVFPEFTPGMPMQVSYLSGYHWQPPTFSAGQPTDYLGQNPH